MTIFPKRQLHNLAWATMAAFSIASGPAVAAKFQDPLNSAARRLADKTALTRQPLMAIAAAGKRLVAVGLRGLIIVSDDQGQSWRQAVVPVQSDLLAVVFVNASKGWAVGHEGVILATNDGGQRWSKQFDGRQAQQKLVAHYQAQLATGDARAARFLDQVKLNTQTGPSLPYLDVYFKDEQTGYAVGSFGMIVKTVDGGASWLPWLEHVDNDEFLNLNAIRSVNGRLFIAGEKGSIFRLNEGGERFMRSTTGYQGSFFGIDGNSDFVVGYGLRGTIYRSVDGGGSWQALTTGTSNTFTGGMVTPQGQLIVVSDGGTAVSSTDRGNTFAPLQVPKAMQLTAIVAAGEQTLVVSGQQGVARMPHQAANSISGTKP